jgi:hypothetical protein
MKRAAILSTFVSFVAVCSIHAQSKLSAKWEELTAAEFRDAIQLSKGACLLPFGILEKHGPHLPLGTDLLNQHSRNTRSFSNSIILARFLKPSTNLGRSPTAWSCS